MPASLLDDVRIASPCQANWNAMTGDERSRFCRECRRHVYNLSDMSRQEAEDLVRQAEGRTCVRFYQREDGTVLTRDCPVGMARWRRRLIAGMVAAGVLFLALTGLAVGLAVSGSTRQQGNQTSLLQRIWNSLFPPPPPLPMVMGEMIAPRPIPLPGMDVPLPFIPEDHVVPEGK